MPEWDIRSILKNGARCALLALAMIASQPAAAQVAPGQGILVSLLGTGTPDLTDGRRGPSTLVQAAGLSLVFDAGRGMTMSLGQLNISVPAISAPEVDAVFFTHYHSDHVNGLADLFMSRYLAMSNSGGTWGPLVLYGPTGVQALADGVLASHQEDIAYRLATYTNIPPAATTIQANTVAPGVVFSQAGVTVTMFPVSHGATNGAAMGYRIDYNGDSVVLSGDTTVDQNVMAQATGADLLIHEVAAAKSITNVSSQNQKILSQHTTPEQAGQIFAATRPGLAVFNHIVRLAGSAGKPSTTDIMNRTRTSYAGPLVMGADRMQIQVLGSSVQVVYTPSTAS